MDGSAVVVYCLLAVFLGGVLVLFAVALGGFLVFRTKKETNEPLFKVKQPQGSIDHYDPFEQEIPVRKSHPFAPEEPEYPGLDTIFSNNSRFLSQMTTEKVMGGEVE